MAGKLYTKETFFTEYIGFIAELVPGNFDIKILGTKNVLFISENGPLGVGKINNNKINPIRIFNIVGKRDVDK